jgi:exosortase A-associated hydrolase 1
MGADLRRSLIFDCADETLIGTLDDADRRVGVLIVTGGRQTRIGPHRMMATLAGELAAEGHPVFRYDRRGVGDSSGLDPGFRDSGPDIAAAAAAFRTACPHLETLWGLGLCDGASALALHHRRGGLDGLILLNPWIVEAEAGSPAPEAIRAHYRERLFTVDGWRTLLTKGFSPSAAIRGLRSAFRTSDQTLADDVMRSLGQFGGPVHILLAERDATARAYLSMHQGKPGAMFRNAAQLKVKRRDSASHSFAGNGDQPWLMEHILAALRMV